MKNYHQIKILYDTLTMMKDIYIDFYRRFDIACKLTTNQNIIGDKSERMVSKILLIISNAQIKIIKSIKTIIDYCIVLKIQIFNIDIDIDIDRYRYLINIYRIKIKQKKDINDRVEHIKTIIKKRKIENIIVRISISMTKIFTVILRTAVVTTNKYTIIEKYHLYLL